MARSAGGQYYRGALFIALLRLHAEVTPHTAAPLPPVLFRLPPPPVPGLHSRAARALPRSSSTVLGVHQRPSYSVRLTNVSRTRALKSREKNQWCTVPGWISPAINGIELITDTVLYRAPIHVCDFTFFFFSGPTIRKVMTHCTPERGTARTHNARM